MKRLRIGHLSTAYHTPFVLMGSGWVERSTGWVEKTIGIEANWRLFPTGPEMIKAFSRGELDIGCIGLPPTMIGIDKGLRVKCVAGGHVEGTILTARKGLKTLNETGTIAETLGQFRGKAIGTPARGSIHDVIIRQLIQEAGLQAEVAVRNFDWADFILEAMEEGVVDGGCGTPPLAILASEFLGARMLMPPSLMWPYNPSYGIVSTHETIENSLDALESFITLHEEACNLIREKPQEAAEMAAKAIGIVGKDFLLEVLRVSPKYCASLPDEYIESALRFVPVLLKMGYITKSLKKADVFQTDIIDRIHKDKPHYNDPGQIR